MLTASVILKASHFIFIEKLLTKGILLPLVKPDISVYTPGASPHLAPKDTRPTKTPLHAIGPPESPWNIVIC